jgi:hypothetical protein
MKTKLEILYKEYQRYIVTRAEVKALETKTGIHLLRVRKEAVCKMQTKAIYNLSVALDQHGVRRDRSFDKKSEEYLRKLSMEIGERFEKVTERELGHLLMHDPSKLEPGLKPLPPEMRLLKSGEVDHLFEDRAGRLVVVEIKRVGVRSTRQAIGQLLTYMGEMVDRTGKGSEMVRGILVVGKQGAKPDPTLEYVPKVVPGLKVMFWDQVIGV